MEIVGLNPLHVDSRTRCYQAFTYTSKSVTVNKVNEGESSVVILCRCHMFFCFSCLKEINHFLFSETQSNIYSRVTCKDGTLGDGKEGDTLTGPCEKGKEGTIKYRCRSGKWEPEETNCILQVILDLEKEVQVTSIIYS